MHYQSRLFATDAQGGFALVVIHGEHAIGGEDTRETGYARAFAGNVAALEDLDDLGGGVLPLRPASTGAAKHHQQMSAGQAELAASGRYDRSMSANYLQNARRYTHAARLAGQPGVRVPRKVLASSSASLLFGYSPASGQLHGETLAGQLRLLSTHGGLSGEWRSTRMPLDPPGKGIDRFGAVVLSKPLALSSEGDRVLLMHAQPRDRQPDIRLIECGLAADLPTMRSLLDTHFSAYLSHTTGWILVRAGEMWLWPQAALQPRLVSVLPKQKSILEWAATTSPDGQTLILPTMDSAGILLIPADGGKQRLLRPHRGVSGDAHAQAAMSSDGRWMISWCTDQLVATDLTEGKSWVLRELTAQTHEDLSHDGFVVRSYVPPAFAFVDGTLLVFDGESVQQQSLQPVAGWEPFVSEAGRSGARKRVKVHGAMDLPGMLAAAGLEHRSSDFAGLYRPGLRLKTRKLGKGGWLAANDERAPALGSSRFGGWPDLSADVAWPTWRDRPMAFIGQFNLAEVHAAEAHLALPHTGLLSFFVGCSEDTYKKHDDPRKRYMVDSMIGTSDAGRDGWRVLYQSGLQDLQRRQWSGATLPELYNPAAVRFAGPPLSLPDEQTVAYGFLPLNPEERDRYNGLLSQLKPGRDRYSDQLLGYPQLLQFTPPELMCERSWRGENPWDLPDVRKAEHRQFAQAASEWMLLLQLTSNPHADMDWGDGGQLYFYIRREALEQADFSQVWLSFEC